MKEAGRITAEALLKARENVKEGISTKELDTIIRNYIEKAGAKPSFLGYAGFPGSACISINDEVIHGIPGKRIVRNGDIVSIDKAPLLDGRNMTMMLSPKKTDNKNKSKGTETNG